MVSFSCFSLDTENIREELLYLGAGVLVIGILGYQWRKEVRDYTATGPYPSTNSNPLTRALQRVLVDKTRTDVSVSWFPLNSLTTTDPQRPGSNGHPVSGAVRDQARTVISNAVYAMGAEKFEISPASHSLDGKPFVHQHYAAADFHSSVADRDPQCNAVLVGIDVDYYLEDPGKYLGYCIPAVFHTFDPIHVSGVDGDSCYRIRDNKVHYDVSGGGAWQHGVWNWSRYGEFIESDVNGGIWLKLMRRLGFNKVVIHKVMHSRPWKSCPNRLFVWCLPQYTCWRFSWLPWDMNTRRLERVSYECKLRPGWNQIASLLDGETEEMISFGRSGENYSVRMPKAHLEVIMALGSTQSVTSRLISLGIKDPLQLAFISQFYSGKPAPLDEPNRIGRPVAPPVHWPIASYADVPETSARTYGRPVINDENTVPMIKRWETMSSSIDARVTRAANATIPHPRYQSYANEFLQCVVPLSGAGIPLSVEEAVAELDKPAQVTAVQQIWETIDMEPHRKIEAFVKNEPCNKEGRIISSFPDARFLVMFSRYTLAFRKAILHDASNKFWFIPGSTPEEIADAVVDYCAGVSAPVEGDFSNMDGSVSRWLQTHVMNAVLHRFFRPEYQSDLRKFTDMMINCPAYSKNFHFKYEAGVGVKSGSPTTCDLNTVLTAFIMYCSIRMKNPSLSWEHAFRSIGLCFGDDSLFEHQYRSTFSRVAGDLGMKLKVETYNPSMGVTFLARVFPDPFNTNTSFQDPLRTWRKLHITMRHPDVPLGSAAVDRVAGYLTTDNYSPVTSEYCTMIYDYYTNKAPDAVKAESMEKRHSRKMWRSEKPYWLTVGGCWPQNCEDVDLMIRVTAARVGLDEEVIRATMNDLNNCTDPWMFTTLNRTDDPTITDSIDADGGITTGQVDPRSIDQSRHAIHSRASGKLPSKPGKAQPGSEGGPGKSGNTGPSHPKGPGGAGPLPESGRRPSIPSSRQPDEQTAHSSGHSRPGPSNGSGPSRGNASRTTRDEGTGGKDKGDAGGNGGQKPQIRNPTSKKRVSKKKKASR